MNDTRPPHFGEPGRPRGLVRLVGAVAFVCLTLLALSTPADAREPATLSIGLGGSMHWVLVSGLGEREAETSSGPVFGAVVGLDLHDYWLADLEFALTGATVDASAAESQPGFYYSGGLMQAGASARYRFLGRTRFSPSVSAGAVYRRRLGAASYAQGIGPQDDIGTLEGAHPGVFHGVAGLGLTWNSGWYAGSTHVLLESRVYSPASRLPDMPSSGADGAKFWGAELRLAVRLSVL